MAWGGAKSVAIARGPASKDEEELRYLKSVALQTWLFGYEVPGACRLSLVCAFCPHATPLLAARLLQTRSCCSRRLRYTSSRVRRKVWQATRLTRRALVPH